MSDVIIKSSGGNALASGSPPKVVPVTVNVEAGDQITAVYAASGTWYSSYHPVCTDDAGNLYTLLSVEPTASDSRVLIWTATAATTGTITVSAKGRWYYGYGSLGVYVTTPSTYSVITDTAVVSTQGWTITLPTLPPAGSLALIGAQFSNVAYSTSSLIEDASAKSLGGSGVSVAHESGVTSTTLGSYNFGSNSSGWYSTIVLSPMGGGGGSTKEFSFTVSETESLTFSLSKTSTPVVKSFSFTVEEESDSTASLMVGADAHFVWLGGSEGSTLELRAINPVTPGNNLFMQLVWNAAAPPLVIPGWTLLSNGQYYGVYTRVATGSDVTPIVYNWDGFDETALPLVETLTVPDSDDYIAYVGELFNTDINTLVFGPITTTPYPYSNVTVPAQTPTSPRSLALLLASPLGAFNTTTFSGNDISAYNSAEGAFITNKLGTQLQPVSVEFSPYAAFTSEASIVFVAPKVEGSTKQFGFTVHSTSSLTEKLNRGRPVKSAVSELSTSSITKRRSRANSLQVSATETQSFANKRKRGVKLTVGELESLSFANKRKRSESFSVAALETQSFSSKRSRKASLSVSELESHTLTAKRNRSNSFALSSLAGTTISVSAKRGFSTSIAEHVQYTISFSSASAKLFAMEIAQSEAMTLILNRSRAAVLEEIAESSAVDMVNTRARGFNTAFASDEQLGFSAGRSRQLEEEIATQSESVIDINRDRSLEEELDQASLANFSMGRTRGIRQNIDEVSSLTFHIRISELTPTSATVIASWVGWDVMSVGKDEATLQMVEESKQFTIDLKPSTTLQKQHNTVTSIVVETSHSATLVRDDPAVIDLVVDTAT